MSTTWEISPETDDITIDAFGNFKEIVDTVKVRQDIREFLFFALDEIVGNSGNTSQNKSKISSKIREAIEILKHAQSRRIAITPDSEKIKQVKSVLIDTVGDSKTSYRWHVTIGLENGETTTITGNYNLTRIT